MLWPGFKGFDFRGILAAVGPAAVASLEHVVVYGEDARDGDFAGPCKPSVPYAALRAAPADAVAPAAADIGCVIFATSGTTKAPKFVCHAQSRVLRHAHDVARGFGLDPPGARVLQVLPLCGMFGFTQALAALAGGAPMRMLPLFDAVEAARALRDKSITHANGGDDMLDRVLAARDEPQPFPALDGLVDRAAQRGVRACGLYGMSEARAAACWCPPRPKCASAIRTAAPCCRPASTARSS